MRGDITELLRQAASGEEDAVEQLYRNTYQQLRRIARGQRSKHLRPAQELNTTALVHEAFLKFERAGQLAFEDREHFYAVAARAMRQLLVDQARHNLRQKRGSGAVHLSTSDLLGSGLEPKVMGASERILDLEAALEELAPDERILRVVECRVFAGMSEEEIAGMMGVNARTVRRDWAKARVFLTLRLEGGSEEAR